MKWAILAALFLTAAPQSRPDQICGVGVDVMENVAVVITAPICPQDASETVMARQWIHQIPDCPKWAVVATPNGPALLNPCQEGNE